MTFSNLKKNMEMVKQQLNPTADVKAIRSTDDSEQCKFNEDALQYQWTGMCVRMAQNNKELIGLSHRMQAIKPKLTECPNIEIVADNQLLLDDMQNIKNRIRNTLVRGCTTPTSSSPTDFLTKRKSRRFSTRERC